MNNRFPIPYDTSLQRLADNFVGILIGITILRSWIRIPLQRREWIESFQPA